MNSWPLRVWAPYADVVEAIVDNDRIPLIPDNVRSGWWHTETSFPAGSRYGFILDGQGPFPDPRSRSQPDGIHGMSCLTDHSSFPWTDHKWKAASLKEAVIYELHVGTFSEDGTFESAIDHLDHLVRLGVTHIELMPMAGFPGSRNWGYDCVSISAPNTNYGGPEGLKTLINTCHEQGLGVIIDVIYNHMGAEGNYVSFFGPYFTSKYPTPWGEGPNLDAEWSEEVRDFFIDNALMWLRDYHADGLRLDAIDKVTDRSDVHFLVDLRLAVDQLSAETGRPRLLIAESASNDPKFVTPVDQGGYGMDAQWTDDIHHSIHSFFTGERQNYYSDFGEAAQLVKALRQGFVYDGCFSPYRGEIHGKSPEGISPERFVSCLQNHDQIGNRPKGDRFHQMPEVGLIEQKIASALILISPFTPLIFMGEEWAASSPFEFFSDHQDPEMAAAVGEGRKEEFGGEMWNVDVPDPQDPEIFSRSKLRWEERFQESHREMLGWYSHLLTLRRANVRSGEAARCEMDEAGWLLLETGNLMAVACLSERSVTIPIPSEKAGSLQLATGPVQTLDNGSIHFGGKGIAIIRFDHE